MSETSAKNPNGYVLDPSSAFTVYPPTSKSYKTDKSPTASPGRLQYMGVYIYDFLCAAHGDHARQQRVSKLTTHALNQIFPSLPYEVKDSAILKKALSGYGNFERVKEIMGWVINTHWGTLALSSKQCILILSLLSIPTTQCCIWV